MRGRRPLEIRELADPAEFHETMDVSKAAWGFRERMISPATDLIAATHSGGLTAGAFENGRMLGFVHGVPRTNMGEPCHHSHLLAVRPEAQGLGLSVRLKLFQRRWCLDHGIRLATWTYDPFLLKNARLNIVRLRASGARLLPNFYGPMGGIYHDLPSDRFEVRWRLADPIVERAAEGREPHPALAEPVPEATPRRIPRSARLLVRFPAGAPGLYRADPEGSLRERRRFARVVTTLFERGYEATWVLAPEGGDPAYLFERR